MITNYHDYTLICTVDSDGWKDAASYREVFHLVTAGSPSKLPWNIHSRTPRTRVHGVATKPCSISWYARHYRIYENNASRKFGAIATSCLKSVHMNFRMKLNLFKILLRVTFIATKISRSTQYIAIQPSGDRCHSDMCFPGYRVSRTHIPRDACFPAHISLGMRVSHQWYTFPSMISAYLWVLLI